MFNNLIESDVHTADLKRQGSFLFATLLCYALLLTAAGVGSIYAYEAQLDNQSLEMTALVTMLPTTAAPPKNQPRPAVNRQQRPAANTDNTALVPMRTMSQTAVDDMRKVPDSVAVTGNNVPPMLPNAVIGNRNIDVGGGPNGGPFSNSGPVGPSTGSNSGNELTRDTPPEIPKVESKPPKKNVVRSLGVIDSKIIRKVVPPYPALAKQARASGPVTVQILLDEQGRVISARATDGHPLLRDAAVRAAYQTKFTPTLLSNEPVKVSGVITFNFVLQ